MSALYLTIWWGNLTKRIIHLNTVLQLGDWYRDYLRTLQSRAFFPSLQLCTLCFGRPARLELAAAYIGKPSCGSEGKEPYSSVNACLSPASTNSCFSADDLLLNSFNTLHRLAGNTQAFCIFSFGHQNDVHGPIQGTHRTQIFVSLEDEALQMLPLCITNRLFIAKSDVRLIYTCQASCQLHCTRRRRTLLC
jgi:hypothetical protein